MKEPLINIINYLRKLVRQYSDITAFGIGEEYELNNTSNFTYPLLHLELPVNVTLDTNDLNRLTIVINLAVYTNIIYDTYDKPIQVTESMITSPINQVLFEDLAFQDQLMNNAFRMLMNIVTKITSDANKSKVIVKGVNIPMVIESVFISNTERVTTKDLYCSKASITLITENTYFCPIESIFDKNVE